MSKVFWTAEERKVLSDEMVKLFSVDLNMTRRKALGSAQLLLPMSRRRKVTDQTAFNEKVAIEAARNKARSTVHANPVLNPEPAPEVEVVKDELTSLLEALVDKIADKVAQRLAEQLQIQVHTTTTTHSEHRPKHNPEPPCNAPRTPKTGVLILGMQPHQGNLLKSEFPDLDITCYDSDEARTKQVLLRAHTIGMTRFLSHQVEDRYKKCPRYHRHPAGVAELKTLLHKIARGEV